MRQQQHLHSELTRRPWRPTHTVLRKVRPFECRDVLEGLAGFGKRAVGCKRFVVEELPHGDVGELLHQLEGVVDVEEHGKEMFSVARADANALWKDQSGILLQLGHVCPWNYQGHWGGGENRKMVGGGSMGSCK